MNQHPAISAMTLVTIWVPFGFDSQELSIFYFRTRIQQLNGHILAIDCFLCQIYLHKLSINNVYVHVYLMLFIEECR